MQSITAKLNSFRKQIRHRQLEQYFAMKRKLMIGEDMEVEQHSFRRIFQEMMEGREMEENLALLSGMSFSKQVRTQCRDDVEAEELYEELIGFLVKYMGEFRHNNSKDAAQRIKCLNIILNLLADKECPNTRLAPVICDFMTQFYESAGSWGFDKELVQVGCLLANLSNNDRFIQETEESCIGFVLSWFQQLLHVRQQNEMTESIYSALLRVVVGMQRRYSLTNSQLPQLFQSQILNILQVSLFNQGFNTAPSGVSYRLYHFVEQLIPVLLMRCPQAWSQRLVRNIFSLLGTYKRSVFSCLCRILKRILTLSSMQVQEQAIAVRNNLRMMIMDCFMSKIIIYLTILELDSKEKILDVVVRLIGCDHNNAPYFLQKFVKEANLQNWMIRTFSIGNEELNLLFFELVAIAKDLGLGEYFSNFLRRVEAQNERSPFSQ